MKTLVIIGYVWPEPKSSAAGSRMLQLIELFTKHVERIIFACPAELSEHALDLSSIQVELQHIALNCSSFDDWLASVDPQWVMFDRFMMEEQFGWRAEQTCPDALRILDMEDVHSLRHARHHAVKQGRELQPEDWFNEQTFREIASILRCDVTFVISEAEMTWLGEHFPIPASHLCYVPFMVSDKTPAIETETPAIETETPALRASLPTFEQRQHFLAIGNFRHAPNWDSVLELKRLWPDIRQQLQKQGINGVELHICGAYPPPKATQLHQPKDGFLIKGWIDDAQQTLANARVLLAPLRFGAGLKGKLLDAMLTRTPAITSPVGAEGMYGASELTPAQVANSDEEFIAQAVAAYCQQEHWQTMSDAAQGVIDCRFLAAVHEPRIWSVIDKISKDVQTHRQNNFIGAMLLHHTLKSTKYMSQWIEAKNRVL